MTLTTPYIDYKTIRDDILSLLRTNYTTLNSGLTSTITATTEQIIAGDPVSTPIPATLYPVVLVKVIRKDEEFLALRNSGRKRPEVTFRIFGITAKVESDTDAEIMLLAKNLESVFRNNIAFGSVILYSDLGGTDFGLGNFDGAYVDVVAIDLRCIVELK